MLSCVILSNQPWMSKGNIFWRLKYLKWFHLTQAERIIIMPFIGNTPKVKSMMETQSQPWLSLNKAYGLQLFSILKAEGLFSSRPPMRDLMSKSTKANQELFSCLHTLHSIVLPNPPQKKERKAILTILWGLMQQQSCHLYLQQQAQ